MIKWNKICGAMILSLMLGMLGGCSKDTATVSEVMEEIKTTEVSDTEDGKLHMDDVILQVGDAEVSYQEVLFYIYQAKRDYEGDLSSQVWDVVLKDGDSFESYAKKELLKQITEIHIICEQAKKEEITLTDMENAEAENKAYALLASATQQDIEKYGLTKEVLEDIFKEHAIAKKMYGMEVESLDKTLNEDDYRQIQIKYIQVMTNGTDKEGNKVSLSDEEKAKASARAGKMLAKAKTLDDFESYAKKKSDSLSIDAQFSKADMPEQFGEAALALKTGEFSDVVEGTDGYYIVYCVEDNLKDVTEAHMEKALKEMQSEHFQKVYTEWSKQYSAEVSVNLWKKISIKMN